MKAIHRMCLWVLGLIMPVFIAACYGMPYGFSKTGRVLDRNTRKGISGLKVTCLDGTADWNYYHTADGGHFMLDYDSPCSEVRVEDVDGPANGHYQDRSVPFCKDCETLEIEVEPR